MKVKLLGKLDYDKLKERLNKEVENPDEIIEMIKEMEIESKIQTVATAGRLSRFEGTVFEILGISQDKTFNRNVNYIKRVLDMGHDSITDHDYLVFGLENVSIVVEQTIIAERFSSFTIKSRREVDFSNAGFYTPDFKDENGIILKENNDIKLEYNNYMNGLFNKYSEFINNGIKYEDARFILSYSYYSNIIMGLDAHALKDLIIKLTKTKYSNIQELKEFGDKLYLIVKERAPYIIEEIDKYQEVKYDPVEELLNSKIAQNDRGYKILDRVKLLTHTKNVDDTILISAIMRRYQFDFERASEVYKRLCNEDNSFKQKLMKTIAFEGDGLELTQANFEFQIPISYAVLTHLTRHRTHDILIPDFVPNIDLSQYKVPPQIQNSVLVEDFHKIFENNQQVYNYFKEKYKICDEDLIGFTLSGNMTNVVTNMDGKTAKHIIGLRACNKTQWETRDMARGMIDEIARLEEARNYSCILGATCETQDFCKEGKECCGKIYALRQMKSSSN